MKKRIDVLLVEKGFARSRTAAALLVRMGNVSANDVLVRKPSEVVPVDEVIKIKNTLPYVGRGGQKLSHAISLFGLNVHSAVVVDIGASTGGFTDCVLQYGAKKVYAIDVGHGQLAPELLRDPRVVSLEGVDARTVQLPEKADIIVIDVSFISVTKIFPALPSLLKDKGHVIVLIKPQFEVGKGRLGKGGVVKDDLLHQEVCALVVAKALEFGLSLQAITESPLLGGSGNKEYLAHFVI